MASQPFQFALHAPARTACFLFVTVLLVGCGAGAGSGSGGNNIVVTINNKVSSIQAGTAAVVFEATAQNDSSNSGVTWSLTANGLECSPACGTLSSATTATVTYTPPISGPAAPNNQPTLTAASAAKTNKSDSDSFIVTAALAVSIGNKFTSINAGFSPFVVNATVQNDPTNSGVNWALTSNGSSCSPQCGNLSGATSANVTYTPPASFSNLQPTLAATSVHDTSKSDSDTFSISKPPISVSIGDKLSTAYAGSGATLFTVNVENDPSGNGVAWRLTTNGAACSPACGTIATGQFSVDYTPPSSVPTSPTTTLIAISSTDNTKSDFDTFTIRALPPVSVAVTQVNSVLAGGSGVNLSANILNDPSSTPSVTWTLSSGGAACVPAVCGSLTNIAAASITYLPPSVAFGPVEITATSTYDATKSALTTFSVTSAVANSCGPAGGKESLLNGHYALLGQGFWSSGSAVPLVIGASFIANGSGGITSGDEDINDSISPQHLTFDSTSGRSIYTVGSDDRGCLQLTNTGGTTTVFHFALGGVTSGTASKGRIIEFDDNSGASNRGSGILRLQDSSAFSLGSLKPQYAFGVGGWSESGTQTLHLSATGSFSNINGAISNGVFDENIGGILFPTATGVLGTISSISGTTGRGSATLSPNVFDWAVYVVNSSELLLVSTDPANFNPVSLGFAIATGNAFAADSLSGNYVAHMTGNTNGKADVNLDLLTMTPGGAQAGTLSGTVYSFGGNGAQTTFSAGVTYNIDASLGRTTLGNPGDNLPILYITTPTDGIAAFVCGVNADALFGVAEVQTSANLSAATYIFGTEVPADNTVANKVGIEAVSGTGALSGTYDQSDTSGLLSGQGVSAMVSLGANGTGNVGANTIAITTGSKLFTIDETRGAAGPAAIVLAEQ